MTTPPPVFPSRRATRRTFSKDRWLTNRVADALPDAEAKHAERLAAALRGDRAERHHNTELHAVLTYIERMSALWQSDPIGLADVVVRLRCDRVRDELYEIAAGRTDRLHPGTVEHADSVLYSTLTAATTGTDYAHATTLVALTIYVRHDDANTASYLLERACAADPQHRVAQTLRVAVAQGLPATDVAAAFLRNHLQH
ncbi:DUF4192 family protein [Nocardia sp. NBC_00511]|uniref:DUF4192 family protein n=1 Tax=Nocardia sp. NBC_00511 TaxID=2903591 RepID=UPI002F9101A9